MENMDRSRQYDHKKRMFDTINNLLHSVRELDRHDRNSPHNSWFGLLTTLFLEKPLLLRKLRQYWNLTDANDIFLIKI